MNPQINVGVVGFGYWGPNLVRNFHSLPDCRVNAVCDASERRLKHLHSLYPGIQGIPDFQAFLSSSKLDAVIVATPVRSHFPLAKASLLAGKHTFIEKPMAASVAECEELVALAEKNGLVLMVGHTFLYSPAVRKIKEIVDAGDIGEIRYMSCRRLNLGLFQKEINVVWDLAPHDLSIILHIMGDQPTHVSCCGQAHVSGGIQDVASTYLSFARGRSATILSSWLDPRKVRETTVVGSKRMIVYDDVAPLEKVRIYDTRVDAPAHYDTFAEFQYAYHYGDSYIPHLKQEEPLKVEGQHFLDCIRQGRVPITSGHQGLALVRILEATNASMKLDGAPISMPTAQASVRPQTSSPEPVPELEAHGVVRRAGNGNGRVKNGKAPAAVAA